MKRESGRHFVWLPLLGFIAMTSALALTHEVWRDEVRAWSVATRAASWSQMLFDLHEEGHPALWYVILRAGNAVFDSPLVLPVASLLIGITAAYLILRFAPFNTPARLLMVFGVFLGYELTIVARNYGIGVLLLVAACALFTRRAERPWLLAAILALMANTSIHAAAASALIFFVWALDLFDRDGGRTPLRPSTIAAMLVVVAGIGVAIATAMPPADMAFAATMSKFAPASIAKAIMVDPGLGLRGVNASLVAATAIPFGRIGLDAETISRVLVNIAVVSVGVSLWRNKKIFAAFVMAIVGFEIIFRLVYPAGLRHEAVLAFLIIALCWIAVSETTGDDRVRAQRRITIGLLPLLVVQAAAMPFVARRGLLKPESMGEALAGAIKSTPRYRDALLMSEPDAFMETLPFYVSNPVFMPRQGEVDYRAFFDNGTKRTLTLSLSRLTAIADSLACVSRRPVLVSVGHRRFLLEPEGSFRGPYGSIFTWTAAEKRAFEARSTPLPWFRGATSDENYRTFEVAPASACKAR